jgi:alkylated DNA repair dioxygenase AlkB
VNIGHPSCAWPGPGRLEPFGGLPRRRGQAGRIAATVRRAWRYRGLALRAMPIRTQQTKGPRWKIMTHSQPRLFPPDLPDGIRYLPGYVDAAKAAGLLAHIDREAWDGTLRRRVQHYGYRYDYAARRARRRDCLGPLPGWLLGIAEALCADGGFATPPEQVMVNEYLPGQGIAPHVDCVPCFGPAIASLSLGSGCAMDFQECATGRKRTQYLAPGSLLVLTGPGRFDWTHGIAARRSDRVDGVRVKRARRVSLTFRTMVFDAR